MGADTSVLGQSDKATAVQSHGEVVQRHTQSTGLGSLTRATSRHRPRQAAEVSTQGFGIQSPQFRLHP